MKTCTRWLLTLVLAAVPMMAVVNSASANSELVPASRLVAPYVTLETGRSTFLFLINTSALDLRGTASATRVGAVHIEFYSKSCTRNNTFDRLSPNDIDQVNVTTSNATSINADASKVGFADIDVRSGNAGVNFGEALGAAGIQANVLLGQVVVADSSSGFTLSYPMAAALGSASSSGPLGNSGSIGASGSQGVIVTRDGSGNANAAGWAGRYEPFPSHIMVPGFYAEGGSGAGAVLSSFMTVVSPADGNWYGGTEDIGEAPGQELGSGVAGGPPVGATLMSLGINMWDGCENPFSSPRNAHMVATALSDAAQGLGPNANRSIWTTACAGAVPGLDELSGLPIGWIDIVNTSCVRGGVSAIPNAGPCNQTVNVATSARTRGIAGVLFETSTVTGSLVGGDVARAWGDSDSIVQSQTGCEDSLNAAVTPCRYNLTDANGVGGMLP